MSKTLGAWFGYHRWRGPVMEIRSGEGELVPQLIEVTGPRAGRVHRIPYGVHVIGRGRDADVQLSDKDVSRRHARIEVGPTGVTLHDLGSKNGVVVRGERVGAPLSLTHGETLTIGDLTLSVSHPASQVSKALLAAGETTVTTTRTFDSPRQDAPSLVLPLVGVVGFGLLALALLLM